MFFGFAIGVQQVFFMHQIQKLLDKIMAKSLSEYNYKQVAEKPKKAQPDEVLEGEDTSGVLHSLY